MVLKKKKKLQEKRTETHHYQNGQSTKGYKDMNQAGNEGSDTVMME